MLSTWRIWSTNSKAFKSFIKQASVNDRKAAKSCFKINLTISEEHVSSKNSVHVQTQTHSAYQWQEWVVGKTSELVYIRWTLISFNELHPPPFSTWSGHLRNWKIFVQLSFVWCSKTEALLFSLAGPPGCGLRRVWPQLPESRPGVLLVSEEPHGRTLGKRHARPSSTGRSHGVLFRSGPIDSSTANTPSPAWISPPTTPVSWRWGWSMGTSPSMTCRLWRTRRASSAAGEEQPPSVISCLPPHLVYDWWVFVQNLCLCIFKIWLVRENVEERHCRRTTSPVSYSHLLVPISQRTLVLSQ